MSAASAIDQARAARAEARSHKAQADFHRRQARLAMERMTRICEEFGIPVEYVVAKRQGQSDNSTS